MTLRLNVAILRFLKSFKLFSILLLLAGVAKALFQLEGLNVGILASVVLIMLFASLANLLPQSWAKALVKIGAGLICIAIFYLFVGEPYLIRLIKGRVLGSRKDTYIYYCVAYIIIYFICLLSSIRSIDQDIKEPKIFHANNIKAFKKGLIIFSAILGVLLVGGFIWDLVLETTFIERLLTGVMTPIILLLISSLLFVRISRDVIYLGVKSVSQQKMLISYIVFGSITVTVTTLLVVFRNKLDAWWAAIVAGFSNIVNTVIRLAENFGLYVASLGASVEAPISNSELIDIAKDFGINPDKIQANLDNLNLPQGGGQGNLDSGDLPDLGGIGAISGMMGGSGGILTGAGAIYNNAGDVINVMVSESGSFGSAEGAGTGNSAAVLMIKSSSYTSDIYLKLKSFGDYNGKGFSDAEEFTGTIDGGYGMNYLAGYSLKQGGTSRKVTLDIKSFTGQYFVPDYVFAGEDALRMGDIMVNGTTGASYSVECYDVQSNYFFYGESSFYGTDGQTVSSYNKHVKETYTKLPSETKSKALSFLATKGITSNSYYYIQDKVNAVQRIFRDYKYSLEYDRTLDKQNDVVISFLNGYSDFQGICQHFAGSTVVLLRALDVPARYVGGMHVGQTDKNTWEVVTANAAHAWVEVYKDNVGWVRLDPTMYAQTNNSSSSFVYNSKEYQDQIKDYQDLVGAVIGGIGGTGTGGTGTGGTGTGGTGTGGTGTGGTGTGGTGTGGTGTGGTGTGGTGTGGTGTGGTGTGGTGTGGTGTGGTGTGGTGTGGTGTGGNDNTDTGNDGNQDDSNQDDGNLDNSNQDKEDDENLDGSETEEDEELNQEQEQPDDGEFPWVTVGIVAGATIAAAIFTTLLITFLRKRKKVTERKIKEKVVKAPEKKAQELITEEESKSAKEIIRENYKEFIRVAGKNGIRKVVSDTTQSLRDKYNHLISPDQAMDVLTGLYRIARYNKNERLSMEDAQTSTDCLQIIQLAIKNRSKEV